MENAELSVVSETKTGPAVDHGRRDVLRFIVSAFLPKPAISSFLTSIGESGIPSAIPKEIPMVRLLPKIVSVEARKYFHEAFDFAPPEDVGIPYEEHAHRLGAGYVGKDVFFHLGEALDDSDPGDEQLCDSLSVLQFSDEPPGPDLIERALRRLRGPNESELTLEGWIEKHADVPVIREIVDTNIASCMTIELYELMKDELDALVWSEVHRQGFLSENVRHCDWSENDGKSWIDLIAQRGIMHALLKCEFDDNTFDQSAIARLWTSDDVTQKLLAVLKDPYSDERGFLCRSIASGVASAARVFGPLDAKLLQMRAEKERNASVEPSRKNAVQPAIREIAAISLSLQSPLRRVMEQIAVLADPRLREQCKKEVCTY